jgi:hypothetical protein
LNGAPAMEQAHSEDGAYAGHPEHSIPWRAYIYVEEKADNASAHVVGRKSIT